MEFGMNVSGNGKATVTSDSMASRIFSVLIVDDDPIIRRINTALLNQFGFKIQVAKNGKQAIDLYCAGAYFDLIFMDMEMPIMDGPTVSCLMIKIDVDEQRCYRNDGFKLLHQDSFRTIVTLNI